jgi:hypothetical protein
MDSECLRLLLVGLNGSASRNIKKQVDILVIHPSIHPFPVAPLEVLYRAPVKRFVSLLFLNLR